MESSTNLKFHLILVLLILLVVLKVSGQTDGSINLVKKDGKIITLKKPYKIRTVSGKKYKVEHIYMLTKNASLIGNDTIETSQIRSITAKPQRNVSQKITGYMILGVGVTMIAGGGSLYTLAYSERNSEFNIFGDPGPYMGIAIAGLIVSGIGYLIGEFRIRYNCKYWEVTITPSSDNK